MAERLVYTVTTGRSGTVFLTELFRRNIPAGRARVFHERLGYPNFGRHSPDASHFTAFNAVGNAPEVAQFFRRKLELDLASPEPVHAEVSHFLCKAGLVENLPVVTDRAEVHLIGLSRDPKKIAWSFANRFDFFNTGFTWLFSLDPRYRNVIVPAAPFLPFGMFGSCVWYVAEMAARRSYYRELVGAEMPEVRWHDVDLSEIVRPEGGAALLTALGEGIEEAVMPPRENATKQEFFGEREREVMDKIFADHWGDPEAAGRDFFRSGRRLGNGPAKSRRVTVSVGE